MNFDIDKLITQLEGKETLLIFLRDNYPDVLEKWKKSNAGVNQTPADADENTPSFCQTGSDKQY